MLRESVFRSLAKGGETIAKSARDAFSAWDVDDIESCLDNLDGLASDAERIARRAREAISELEVAKT